MRIKKEDAEARYEFARKIFTDHYAKNTDPLAVAKANDQVKSRFGRFIRGSKMYEIRAEVEAAVAKVKTGGAPAITSAARGRVPSPQIKAARRGAIAKLSNMDAFTIHTTDGKALEAGLAQLRAAGLTNLKIDYVNQKKGYAVVTTE